MDPTVVLKILPFTSQSPIPPIVLFNPVEDDPISKFPSNTIDKFELLFNNDLAPPLPADEVRVLTAFVNVTTEN